MPKQASTGSQLLDAFLQGGYETDTITTLYGPAGCGKTTLALLAAIACARSGKKAIYLDTEGGFSVERLKQLTAERKKVQQSIIFLKPTRFEEQTKAIEKLNQVITPSIGLIIIDSLSMLYRLERSTETEQSKTFTQQLGAQLRTLSEITRRKNVSILLTSQVYSSFDQPHQHNPVRLVGGELVKYASKCILEIQSMHGSRRKLILRKHRSIGGEKEVLFDIVQTGIHEVTV